MKVWLDARRMEERGEAHAYLRERLDLERWKRQLYWEHRDRLQREREQARLT